MTAALLLVTLLAATPLGSAQLFPFASLQEYFDHQARHGPGVVGDSSGEESAQVPAVVAASESEGVQVAEESAHVGAVSREPASVLTPPDPELQSPLPTFHSQKDTPADAAASPSYDSLVTPVFPSQDPVSTTYLQAKPTYEGQESVESVFPTYSLQEKSMNNGQKSIESIFPAYSSQEKPTKDGHKIIESFFPTYNSQGKPTIDGQKSIEPIYPAYYDSTQAKPLLNGQRNAGAYALAAYSSPAIPAFESQRNVQPSQAVALKTPLPLPNPYLTAPKPAIKAVPFASYPSPPQVYEVGPTPLKLSKAYPKKYRPELEQPKKPANLKAQYPLTKLKKQSAHHVAATKQAASFHDKGPVVAAKTSAPAVTKLSPSAEQSAAASGFAHSADIAGHGSGLVNHHDAVAAGLGPGHDRVEFQMYGHRGPHSYKFGFDTGKGHNRQFRFEERDPDGHVKGHYGFYSKDGKLQVISYSAHPQHGFHANGNFGKHAI